MAMSPKPTYRDWRSLFGLAWDLSRRAANSAY
jgi:hypothetical protein